MSKDDIYTVLTEGDRESIHGVTFRIARTQGGIEGRSLAVVLREDTTTAKRVKATLAGSLRSALTRQSMVATLVGAVTPKRRRLIEPM